MYKKSESDISVCYTINRADRKGEVVVSTLYSVIGFGGILTACPYSAFPNLFCAYGVNRVHSFTELFHSFSAVFVSLRQANETYGDACPPGRFCPEGTATPQLCPVGTYSNVSGLKMSSECQPCTGGSACTA